MNYYRIAGPLTVEQSIQEWTAWWQLFEAGELAVSSWETDQEEALVMRRLRHPEVRRVPPSPPWLSDAAVVVAVCVAISCVVLSVWSLTR